MSEYSRGSHLNFLCLAYIQLMWLITVSYINRSPLPDIVCCCALKKNTNSIVVSVGVPGHHSSFHGPLPASTTIHPCYPAVLLLALSLQLPQTCSSCQTRRLSVCLHPILGYDIHINVQLFHFTVLWTVTRLTLLYIHITSTFFFFFFFFYDFSSHHPGLLAVSLQV